jgi:hypothetical protein
MNSDPVDVALREITDTKRLLEALLTSSERFDYQRAKATVEELRLKIRVLGRLELSLMAARSPARDRIIPFPQMGSAQRPC